MNILTDNLHELVEVLRRDHLVLLADEFHFYFFNRSISSGIKTRESVLPVGTRMNIDIRGKR